MEKAHSDVFDVLLQVLDNGRLTDGQGRTVDFRNTILVLTSNFGSAALADATLDEWQRTDAVLGVVRRHFNPEFLNRLEDLVVFGSLSTEELTSIVDIQIGQLARRLAARRLTLDVTDVAKEWLALGGFDPLYGARPSRTQFPSPSRASRPVKSPAFARSICSRSSSVGGLAAIVASACQRVSTACGLERSRSSAARASADRNSASNCAHSSAGA